MHDVIHIRGVRASPGRQSGSMRVHAVNECKIKAKRQRSHKHTHTQFSILHAHTSVCKWFLCVMFHTHFNPFALNHITVRCCVPPSGAASSVRTQVRGRLERNYTHHLSRARRISALIAHTFTTVHFARVQSYVLAQFLRSEYLVRSLRGALPAVRRPQHTLASLCVGNLIYCLKLTQTHDKK